MSAITDMAGSWEQVRRTAHPACVVCGRHDALGLDLRFALLDDGAVESGFSCPSHLQGYDGILHGGMVASLLDGAMTNCLFAHGIVAVTAAMTVRFRHPVAVDVPALVRADLAHSQAPLHVVRASIVQGGQVKAKATGKFMAMGGRGNAAVDSFAVTAGNPGGGEHDRAANGETHESTTFCH